MLTVFQRKKSIDGEAVNDNEQLCEAIEKTTLVTFYILSTIFGIKAAYSVSDTLLKTGYMRYLIYRLTSVRCCVHDRFHSYQYHDF